MALYVGEAVRIRASALDPETQLALDPPPQSATVSFWGPDKDPKKDPSVRAVPDVGPIAMTASGAEFTAFVSTAGNPWVPGKWSYRVTVVGDAFENFEFGTFKLKE